MNLFLKITVITACYLFCYSNIMQAQDAPLLVPGKMLVKNRTEKVTDGRSIKSTNTTSHIIWQGRPVCIDSTIPIIPNSPYFCSNKSSVTLTCPVTASSYQWYTISNSYLNIIFGARSSSLVVTQPGLYLISLNNTSCLGIYQVLDSIPFYDSYGNTISAYYNCSNTPQFSLYAPASSSYQWYLNNSPIPGGNNQNIKYSVPGYYYVQTTNASGCNLPSNVLYVGMDTVPNIKITGDSCSFGNLTMSLVNNIQHLTIDSVTWSLTNPITDSTVFFYSKGTTIADTVSGNYTSYVNFSDGCTNTGTYNVANVPVPVVSLNKALPLCQNDSVVLTSSVNSYLQWYINGNPVPGATGSSITCNQPGKYSAGVSSNYFAGVNCNILSAPINIVYSNNALPVLSIKGNNCTNDTLSVTSNLALSKIIWQYQGNPIDTVFDNSVYQTNGITVAGGNGQGAANNQLLGPNSVYVDAGNNIYISDYTNNRIQKWAPGAVSGITVAGGNGIGSASNQLKNPSGIFADKSGNVYVSDNYNNRIQKWASGATTGITVAGGNGQGYSANQLYAPAGIFVDGNGNIFVADSYNARIQKWTPGANSGITVAGGSGQGSAANQLSHPTGVFVDGNGNIFIADTYNSRIQKWSPGASKGITVAGGNGQGSAANQLSYPTGVFVDGNGYIFIADANNNRIQKWAPGASSGITVAGINGPGSSLNQLNNPTDVFLDPSGNIYVSDYFNNRILKFNLTDSIVNTIKTANAGTYSAQVLAKNGCISSINDSVSLTIHAPSVTISASTGNTICSGTVVNFSATAVNGGNTPIYKWYKNNKTVGVNSNNYTDSLIKNGDSVWCVLVSGYACLIIDSAKSPVIKMSTYITPNITVQGQNCIGDSLTMFSNLALSQIEWFRNDTVIANVNSYYSAKGTNVANQLYHAKGLYVDKSGNVYVSDQTISRVQKWAPGATTGITVAGGNGTGSAANQLAYPGGIYVDGAGNIYIADWGNNRIQKWAPGASSGITVAGGGYGSNDSLHLIGPIGVYVDVSGNVYVLNQSGGKVQKWAPGANYGKTVAAGVIGSAANEIGYAEGFYIDQANTIYIADAQYNRIQKWVQGATSGITVAGGNGAGNAANQLNSPSGVYVDSVGNIYVTDYGNNRIQMWVPGAVVGITIAGGNIQGSAANQISLPNSVFQGPSKSLYVAGGNQVLKFSRIDSVITSNAIQTLSKGNYRIQSFSNNSCPSNTVNITVNPNAVSLVTISANSTNTICSGTKVSLTANPVNAGTPIYQWYKNNLKVGNAGNVYTDSLLNNNDSVWVVVTGNAACVVNNTAKSNVVKWIVNQKPAASIKSKGKTAFCQGGTDTLIASLGSSYQWYQNGSAIPSATKDTFVATIAGIYNVKVTNSSGCIASSVYDTVTVNTLPAASVITNSRPLSFCNGDSTVLTSSLTTGIQWQMNNANITGATGAKLTVKQSGSYTVVTTNSNGCSAVSAITTVKNNPIPGAPLISTAGNATGFCSGSYLVLSSDSASGNQWYYNGTAVTTAKGVNDTARAAGNYALQFTSSAGCISPLSAAKAITVNALPPIPTITSKGNTSFCQGLYDILSSSSSTGNQWKLNGTAIAKASTSQNFVANVAGNYSVTVTNAAGCTATSTATAITILPTPAKPVITEDANLNLVSSATKGNQWYSPELLTGDTGKVYTPWVNGTYYVQVTVGGCISPMSDAYVYNNPNLNKESLRATGTSTLDSKAVQLYPNPVGNTLKISYQISGIQNVTAEILDMNGNMIARKESVTSGSSIDVSGYASGMYIIRLVNGENQEVLYTTKVVKAK